MADFFVCFKNWGLTAFFALEEFQQFLKNNFCKKV